MFRVIIMYSNKQKIKTFCIKKTKKINYRRLPAR